MINFSAKNMFFSSSVNALSSLYTLSSTRTLVVVVVLNGDCPKGAAALTLD